MKTPLSSSFPLALFVASLSCAPVVRAQTSTPPGGTIAATPAGASRDAAAPTAAGIQQIVDKVKPSLVRIHVVEAQPEEGHETKEEAFGSGIVVSPDGYVVTNHHVAGNARWLSCTLSSKEEVGAHLVGTDPLADIAVIKLDPQPSGAPYPAIEWGDSSKLRVGDSVLAMGSPLAFSQSVTSGIVSNTELIFPETMGGSMLMEGEDVGSIVRWIGHDAQIFPGNSGGPLISMAGQIVGINEIGVGLSGAIPSRVAHAVADQLIAQKHVTRAYTGLELQPRLRGADNSAPGGVLVGGVLPRSPAQAAGVKAGDVLLRVGGATLTAQYPEEIPLANLQVANLPVGVPVGLDILRAGMPMAITITPGLRAPAESPSLEVKGWGMTASDITPSQALELREAASAPRGVMVTSLATGGPTAQAQPPLQGGDVLLTVGGKPVPDMAALKTVTAGIVGAGSGSAGVPTLVEVKRDGQRILTVVALGKGVDEDVSDEVAKAWLPIEVQAVTPTLADALHLPTGTHGVRVTQIYGEGVTSGAPAAATEQLKVGDLLTKLDGETIDVSQPEETATFFTAIRQYHIGALVKTTVMRDGKPIVLTLKTIRAPKGERELARYADSEFGITLRSVNYKDRADEDAAPGETGAMVLDVTKGSWAALGGLRNGDIVHRIDGATVTNLESAEAALKSLEARRPSRVTFFVSRGIHTLYVQTQTDYVLSSPLTQGATPPATTAPSAAP